MIFSSILVLLFLFTSSTFAQEQVGMTAYESIRKLKECMDLIDKPEFRRTCEGKIGKDKDECVEKFTKQEPSLQTIEKCHNQVKEKEKCTCHKKDPFCNRNFAVTHWNSIFKCISSIQKTMKTEEKKDEKKDDKKEEENEEGEE